MLLSIASLPDDLLLGLWQIELKAGLNARQNERHAVSMLLAEMLHVDSVVLQHLPSGKPTLDGWHVSVSHTKGYAAALLSRTKEVGIDIEYRSDRVSRIASRFLRDDEKPQSVEEQLAYWSAKESLFKLFSEDQLTLQEMRISPLDSTHLRAENLKRGISVEVCVEENDRFTLTYAHHDF